MNEHELPPNQTCPHCGHKLSHATDTTKGKPPRSGDASICVACEGVTFFDADMRQRVPTPEEQKLVDADPRIARMIRLLRRSKRGGP